MKKRKLAGGLLMGAGALLVCGALALFAFNQRQDARAGAAAEEALPKVMAYIEEEAPGRTAAGPAMAGSAAQPVPEPVYGTEMTEVLIDGNAYIGYLTLPTLDLELPVMSSWSYAQLKIAPCRYGGSTKTDNLVVCAHNYDRHFGRLKNLTIGDEVYFTDMDGVTSAYTVVSIETLQPTAVEEMTNGGFDLTLFTCTYGGATRVTVRCSSANAGS